MSKKNLLVSEILSRDACVGCGVCPFVCPYQALSLMFDNFKGRYTVHFNDLLCSECNLCFKICPTRDFIYEDVDLQRISKKIHDCYIGFSGNPNVRFHGSSGGLVTHLITHLLSKKVVDAAVVVRSSRKNPIVPEVTIAHDPMEVFESMGSKYAPVPLGLALKNMVQSRQKFVIVGLPCHIRAFRKVENLLGLKNKIVLYMGLFCNRAPVLLATRMLIARLGINEKDVTEIRYRGTGWPGYFKVRTKKGNEVLLPSSKAWDFLSIELFAQKGCLMCSDPLNTQADVSFGDPWLKDLMLKEKEGATLAIVFTEKGRQLLEELSNDSSSIIELEKFPYKKAVQSQLDNIFLRSIYRSFCSKFLKIPLITKSVKHNAFLETCFLFMIFIMLIFQEKPFTYQILERTPKQIISIFIIFKNLIISFLKNKKNYNEFVL